MSNTLSIQPTSSADEVNQNFDEISMGAKIVGTTLGVSIGMTANFCLSYSMHYAMESIVATCQKLGSIVNNGISLALSREINEVPFDSAAHDEMILNQQTRRLNYSMLAAVSVPIQPVVRHCFEKLLNCKAETPWRNSAATIASSFTSVALASTACNQLGYEIDTTMLLYNQAISLCLIPTVIALMKGVDYLTDQLEEMIDSADNTQDEDVIKEPSNLDPARVTILDNGLVSKTEMIKQQLLSPIDSELAVA